MTNVCFKIVHKATGVAMPARMQKTTRNGWSYWEPTEPVELGNRGYRPDEPRIFYTYTSAVGAATQWARGHHKREQGETSGSWEEPPEYYDEMTVNQPKIPRKYSDLEIIEGEIIWHQQPKP